MSANDLARLADAHAFDPFPRREDLAAYHVPFDQLTGQRLVEERLRVGTHRGHRSVVMGASGVGKSSVIAYTLGPLEQEVVPFRVSVADEPVATVSDAKAFVQHLVRTVSLEAQQGALISEADRSGAVRNASDNVPVEQRARTRRWGWASRVGPELTVEISSTTAPAQMGRSTSEVVGQAARLMELVQAHKLLPVVVIDDADAWLALPGGTDRLQVAEVFFGQVLRSIIELPCALVIAAHHQYKQLAGFQACAGLLEFTVEIPRLPDPSALEQLVDGRVRCHLADRDARVLGMGASERLFDYYAGPAKTSLRRMLVVLQGALELASEQGDELIEERSIEAAHAQI
jgi:Cdc6-like AAA superfamily ATPase